MGRIVFKNIQKLSLSFSLMLMVVSAPIYAGQGDAEAQAAALAAALNAEAPVATPAENEELSGSEHEINGKPTVLGLNFEQIKPDVGVLHIDMSTNKAVAKFTRKQGTIIVNIPGGKISEKLIYVMDVSEHQTPVTAIETFRSSEGVRIELINKGEFSYSYKQEGERLSVTVERKAMQVRQLAKNNRAGIKNNKPITLNFQNIPVRSVLQLIADYNNFNLVVADSVQGSVTLQLNSVPWQEALDVILQLRGLERRIKGNIMLIAPESEFDAQDQDALAADRKKEELAPLDSAIIRLDFAKAEEVAGMLAPEEEGQVAFLTERGSVSVDLRTNSLIIKEIKSNMASIRQVVELLDIPVKQVLIEARIVTMNETDAMEIGVRWGSTTVGSDMHTGGSIEHLSEMNYSNHPLNLGMKNDIDIKDTLNVNMGATADRAAQFAFQFAGLGDDILLDLELSALQSENRAEIIASPRLMTTNKSTAYIEQGTEVPYLESSSSGAATIAFKKAVLSLGVTPQITEDDRLVLDLEITQDEVGEVVTKEVSAPSIRTQRLKTQVLVNNGETIVLGGIYKMTTENTAEKVPFFGDIPIIGAAFRYTSEMVTKSELLIFITPKIVTQ
ncbi:Type IV pilus biogenesis and competence protein PilQ [Vibrio stylophorae]|uniref:Type IV pilus biogenesis and competence protein PilQ n=1 Tax=Vibrio stylophorae TaxID=659351 RepID=A0ABN8DU78_9VIBR|nr:type IV pilus secretin PilQ [Vibrio stylophorae]CAH0534591.1 Type IV pilus biogenesis and competence protein PilQ [Vibrio stylophorae]